MGAGMQPAKRKLILEQRRKALKLAWALFVYENRVPSPDTLLSAELISSWQRSLKQVLPSALAPEFNFSASRWVSSPLCAALEPIKTELEQLVEEGNLVAALTDELGQILWISASEALASAAHAIHFSVGSQWNEASIGTNAIGLALRQQKTQVVFAAEHFSEALHDWVAYAAPITHAQTNEVVGVFCIATHADLHTPLGEMAVADIAHTLRRHLPEMTQPAELQLYALGFPQVIFRGKPLHVSLRQLEILCLLSLHPQGITLAELHRALYSDPNIAPASLKASLSHLRHLLDGQIGSRPYQILVSTWSDYTALWQVLKEQNLEKALNLYRGSLLPLSTSPELTEWRNYTDAIMEKVVANCLDPQVLMDSLAHNAQGKELVRERLAELLNWELGKND